MGQISKRLKLNSGEERLSISQAVREARKLVGTNNDMYLQVGISMLWTGDAGNNNEFDTTAVDMYNTLFPSSIKSYGSMQQLSVDATALSLLRGRKEALETRNEHLKKEFLSTLLPILSYLLSMPEVSTYIKNHFEQINATVENNNLQLRQFSQDITDRLRYTKELMDNLFSESSNIDLDYGNLNAILIEALSNEGYDKFVKQMITLIDMLTPLLECDENQKYGSTNMAMINTMMCDAAANEKQFPTSAVANLSTSVAGTNTSNVDPTLYRAAVHANSDISTQIQDYKLTQPTETTTESSAKLYDIRASADTSDQNANTEGFSPFTGDSLYKDASSQFVNSPFWPLKTSTDNDSLTAMQIVPVYICATRQLFCTPSPLQNFQRTSQPASSSTDDTNKKSKSTVYAWYVLPQGSFQMSANSSVSDTSQIEGLFQEIGTHRSNSDDEFYGILEPMDSKDFSINLRVNIIKEEILNKAVIPYSSGDFSRTEFKSYPVVNTQWLPIEENINPDQVNFLMDKLTRAACRSAVLGALSTGATKYFNFSSGLQSDKSKLVAYISALTKIHQLSALMYTRKFEEKSNTWKEAQAYQVWLNVRKSDSDKNVYMYTPVVPLYMNSNASTIQSNFESSPTNFNNFNGARVLPFSEGAISKKEYYLDFEKGSIDVSNTGYKFDLDASVKTLSNEHALLEKLCTHLFNRPYNRRSDTLNYNTVIESSYADDSKPLIRLMYRSVMANRMLLEQYKRYSDSALLLENMLKERYDSRRQDLAASGLRDDEDNKEGEDGAVFYQGQAALNAQLQRGIPDAVERGRREAVWKDALRELAISGDRLFVFLKTLAGMLHDDVTNIIKMEDRSMEQAQRVRAEQRREALRATMSFSQRSMDALMSAIFRQSNFRLDVDKNQNGAAQAQQMTNELVVVSDETVERIRRLASETNNRSFFETQSQLTSFLEQQKGVATPLVELVNGVRRIVQTQLQESLDMANRIDVHDERGAIDFLAQPRNSLIIRLKNETFAAIRQAYDALQVEMNVQGQRLIMQNITVYTCVEGPSRALCDQFAALSAYFMSQSRVFSSSASVYVSAQSASSNALMLRIALQKCVRRAIEYHRGFYN